MDAVNVWVIHCPCERLYDRTDVRSLRITSIAIRKLDAGQTVSFYIHQVAEPDGLDLAGIRVWYEVLERKMLDACVTHIRNHRGIKYLHWNMRDNTCGFAAIERGIALWVMILSRYHMTTSLTSRDCRST